MKLKGSAFRSTNFKGYASTYVVEFLVLVSNLLVYKLCIELYADDGLAELSIFKRIFSFIQPLLLFGLLIGITRYVALSKSTKEQIQYFFTSFLFFFFLTVLILFGMNLFSAQLSVILFDDLSFEKYIVPLSISLSGIYFHFTIYGFLRGKHDFILANCLQLINMSIVPVAAFFLKDQLADVLFVTGLTWMVISVCYFIYLFIKERYNFDLFKLNKLKILIKYGLPRVPGDLAFGGLFALPLIFVSHFKTPDLAGPFAFSLSLLNIVGAAFSPLSLMLLPTISQKLSEKKYIAVGREINRAIILTVILSGIGVLFYEIFAIEILSIYLGDEIMPWVRNTQIIMLGGVFYALFITLRSVIDAYHERAVNSFNLVVSLMVFCIGAFIAGSMGLDILWFYTVFLFSLLVLVALTLISVYKIQKSLLQSN